MAALFSKYIRIQNNQACFWYQKQRGGKKKKKKAKVRNREKKGEGKERGTKCDIKVI